MKQLPMVLVLGIAICSFVLVAVNGFAAEPVGAADTLPAFGALCAAEPPVDWQSAEATSLACTAPPGCIDPAGYCDCVAGGTVPEWVCRWYACG